MIRAALLTGFTWTIACAPAPAPLLAPEPTATSFAAGARWQSVEPSRDYTALIDIVPTATRDAVGVRIGGTGCAESNDTTLAREVPRSRRRQ